MARRTADELRGFLLISLMNESLMLTAATTALALKMTDNGHGDLARRAVEAEGFAWNPAVK